MIIDEIMVVQKQDTKFSMYMQKHVRIPEITCTSVSGRRAY
jgi:hypothetical protein